MAKVNELFDKFVKDPKNTDIQTVTGSKNYIESVIAKDVPGPTLTTLVHLFGHFSKGTIKEYIYLRMTKSNIIMERKLVFFPHVKPPPKRSYYFLCGFSTNHRGSEKT